MFRFLGEKGIRFRGVLLLIERYLRLFPLLFRMNDVRSVSTLFPLLLVTFVLGMLGNEYSWHNRRRSR